jgi:hypothetical protein
MDYYINDYLSDSPYTGYSPYIVKLIINIIVHLLAIILTPESLLLI